jgi:hypothetical protein
MIARIADALGFNVPSEELFLRAARLLRVFGYRRLSGFWMFVSNNRDLSAKTGLNNKLARGNSISRNILPDDPYARKMERIRSAVVSSPGSLAPEIRQAISEGGHVPGPLGTFVQKVSQHAYKVNDNDIAALHRAHYSDDQIFEAAVSAALGAGLYRLERVRAVLHANQPAAVAHTELPSQDQSFPEQTHVNVNALI